MESETDTETELKNKLKAQYLVECARIEQNPELALRRMSMDWSDTQSGQPATLLRLERALEYLSLTEEQGLERALWCMVRLDY
jgi:hypothetical protein